MGRYMFQSELSPDQVMAQLSAHARPWHFGCSMVQDQIFWKNLPNGGFYLMKTSSSFPGTRQFPFVGQLRQTEGGCCITGNFGYTRSMKLMLLISMIAIAATALLSGVPIYVAAAGVLIWGGLGYCLQFLLPSGLWHKKEREATLQFIESHLLKS